MNHVINGTVRDASLVTLSLLAWQLGGLTVEANPTGGSVASGSATINSAGSQLTVHTSASAIINWSSFNIGRGETTTFVQPSRSSVVWNNINDASPSQILGNLNANGYVILQNANGFYIGGSASLNAAGLVLTTSGAAPSLSSGAWQFNALPPTASIINYGQITVAGGGSAYLIANNIENHGTISAEQGKVGLYAGKEVLVSTSPDGRGLNAKVTLPQGSVDNQGRLVADGGSILMQAKTVNSGGLIQANSVRDVDGTIELLASDSVNLSASSAISAQGAGTGVSAGGTVTIKADQTFSDAAGSTISVAGGVQGGNGGQVEISAPQLGAMQSHIDGHAAAGYVGGKLIIDPTDFQLSSLNLSDYFGISGYDITTDGNITIDINWNLGDAGSASLLNLTAGNSIIVDAGMHLIGGNNWTLNLVAGTAFTPSAGQPTPAAGGGDGNYNYGVYLDDGAYVQTQNGTLQTQTPQPSAGGNINIWAANEVIIHNVDLSSGTKGGAIRTRAGGNISVTAEYGDVNAGNNIYGYSFANNSSAAYYRVNAGSLGGISTAAGGNVTINAGGDVISYLPTQYDYDNYSSKYDAGTGAFGSQAGNVTITAGGSVLGNYVVANGVGTITAGKDCGASSAELKAGFALSLIKGSWSVNAQNIYLDAVLNPNGVFNDNATDMNGEAFPGYHYYNYDSAAALTLHAAKAVEITGAEVPLRPASDPNVQYGLPDILPPTVNIVTGSGGLTLDADVLQFPSATGDLSITTTGGGNFAGRADALSTVYNWVMSDKALDASSGASFTTFGNLNNESFGAGDHGTAPLELNNPNPVEITVAGDLNNVNLYATKQTEIKVAGNMYNSGFVGENLHASDATTVTVGGSISFPAIYSFVTLADSLPANWDFIFSELVDPNLVSLPINASDIGNPTALKADAANMLYFSLYSPNPGFVYDAKTKQLGYAFQMSATVYGALTGTREAIKLDASRNPVTHAGDPSKGEDPAKNYFTTVPVDGFVANSVIDALNSKGLGLVAGSKAVVYDSTRISPGFQISGPGQLNITAQTIDLGATSGILSWGGADGSQTQGGVNYGSLALERITGNSGAAINVTTTGDLDMLTSTIATVGGGNVTVNSVAGGINLGLSGFALSPFSSGNLAFGIYSSAAGDVSVTAHDTINVYTARIGSFNGGNVFVKSLYGDVNAGNGIDEYLQIIYYYFDPLTGLPALNASSAMDPAPFGSGIMSIVPTAKNKLTQDEVQGNILVETPNGSIISTLGGISQFALNDSTSAGVVTLTAGLDIELGQGGVLGGTVNLTAGRNVVGWILSRRDVTVVASGLADVHVLAGGNASLSAKSITGDIIANGAVSTTGDATAAISSGSVSSDGGAAKSTLGVASTSAAAQSAAGQSGNETKQTLAKAENNYDDDKKKNKHGLMQRVKRVTVILPKT